MVRIFVDIIGLLAGVVKLDYGVQSCYTYKHKAVRLREGKG